MPGTGTKVGEGGTATYVPVAHGMVPWWTEAYETQFHGWADVPFDRWIRVRAKVRDRVARIEVNGQPVLQKTLTYYLDCGRVGVYMGTGTDAAFRNIRVTPLSSTPETRNR